jgi:hypothetical protein
VGLRREGYGAVCLVLVRNPRRIERLCVEACGIYKSACMLCDMHNRSGSMDGPGRSTPAITPSVKRESEFRSGHTCSYSVLRLRRSLLYKYFAFVKGEDADQASLDYAEERGTTKPDGDDQDG